MKYTDEFAEFLSMAFDDYPLRDRELIVVPPSGTADSSDQNHMVPLATKLEDEVGIPFRDITYKKEDFASQKGLSLEERIDNVIGKIGCEEDSIEADKALVVDDIATSCATISATAEALIESGVDQVAGLAIAKGIDIQGLRHADVLKKAGE
jgi:predicted amidophosphoribosyltransferase